jgi:hypothetical protein
VLGAVRQFVPNCNQIHLFYGGPTGGAVVIGQAINPRMKPTMALYEFDRWETPHYQHRSDVA